MNPIQIPALPPSRVRILVPTQLTCCFLSPRDSLTTTNLFLTLRFSHFAFFYQASDALSLNFRGRRVSELPLSPEFLCSSDLEKSSFIVTRV